MERSCAASTWLSRTCATCPQSATSPSTPARRSKHCHPPTSSCLDAALAAYRHQSSILGDVHRYCRLHVFDADLDLLVVTPRIEILFINLIQIDKLSLQLTNDTKVPQLFFLSPAPRWQGHQQLIQARDQFGILRLPPCKAIHPGCPDAYFIVGIFQWCTSDANLVPELVLHQLWVFSMHLIHNEVGDLGIEIEDCTKSWKELTCKFLSINQFISKSSSSSPKGLIRASATLKYWFLTWMTIISFYLKPSHIEEELKKSKHWNNQINLKTKPSNQISVQKYFDWLL